MTSQSEHEGDQTVEEPSCPIKRPCILIFDSLPGRSRAGIIATLRDYLTVEYEYRRGVSKVF
ncbi:UNVERIFIED_CONTAM: hypothetical protein GTU68_052309, partial [Idotea baltica]|nr:hypothetical protein [Idotea baltica]